MAAKPICVVYFDSKAVSPIDVYSEDNPLDGILKKIHEDYHVVTIPNKATEDIDVLEFEIFSIEKTPPAELKKIERVILEGMNNLKELAIAAIIDKPKEDADTGTQESH